MIYVEMNKDVREYKEKLVGPFSARETLCLAMGFGLTYLVKTVFFSDVSLLSDVSGFIAIACFIPFIGIGWGKIFGMYIEEFATSALKTVIAPKIRVFDNGNAISKEKIKTKKSKNPDLQGIK